LATALLAVLPMVVLYPLWAHPLSAGEDDAVYYFPLRTMVGDALERGHWPMHNLREAGGVPLMGDTQSAVLYPPTWLFAAVPDALAYSLNVFLAFAVAGAGMSVYLRSLGLRTAATSLGMLAMMFSGFLVGHRVHLAMLHTAAYLPWLLWCVEHSRREPVAAFLAAVPIGYLTITSGHWGIAMQMGLGVGVYFLLRARPIIRAGGPILLGLALAAMLAAPMIAPAAAMLEHSTRDAIGYASVGENSFFPAAAVLAVFPMLMGSRTPGFYPQEWWGVWHLCEMLPYVGLVTLVLAGVAIAKLYRRGGRNDRTRRQHRLTPIVRVWTWLAAGAVVWMLGYYLPTYRLVRVVPLLGSIRCPARLILLLDAALAVLAACGLHAMLDGSSERAAEMRRSAVRVASRWLPIVMVAALLLVAAGAAVVRSLRVPPIFPFAGGPGDALRAVVPTNPAVWVPLLTWAATAAVVLAWRRRPKHRAWWLVVLLAADLAMVARFVDIPPDWASAPGPMQSRSAGWLKDNAPVEQYRVWGLAESYHHRPAELLLPKTCEAMGVATISGYGPWQHPKHAHLLGFDHYGQHPQWEWLVRTNHLLSLHSVRYLLAGDPEKRAVIESVVAPEPNAVELTGPELIGEAPWELRNASATEAGLRLRTPLLWQRSEASLPVDVRPARRYRLSFEARGPDRGAALWLKAELYRPRQNDNRAWDAPNGQVILPEQIGERWRRFEANLKAPNGLRGPAQLRFYTLGERPVEVRNVSLREATEFLPRLPGDSIAPGRKVYRKLIELPPRREGDPNVVIYENPLALPIRVSQSRARPGDHSSIEAVKWLGVHPESWGQVTPIRLAWRTDADPAEMARRWTLPAVAVYLLGVLGIALWQWRSGRRNPKNQ
jgi:hypothetical protein